jgi:hypothetical protein
MYLNNFVTVRSVQTTSMMPLMQTDVIFIKYTYDQYKID